MNILLIIIVLIAGWSLYGYFSSHVEQAQYTVEKKANGYEIRKYPSHIVAQTTVDGSYDQAVRNGFSIVANYIFGANEKKNKIAMTSPVVVKDTPSEKIAMTAPVMVEDASKERVISFGMPKSYTLDTLPVPLDPRVKVVEIPEKRVAAIRFSGYRSYARVQRMEQKLSELLAQDGIQTTGTPFYAGYNAPWTPPWMMRNEVMIELR